MGKLVKMPADPMAVFKGRCLRMSKADRALAGVSSLIAILSAKKVTDELEFVNEFLHWTEERAPKKRGGK